MNKSTDAVTKPEKVGVDERIVAQITRLLRTPVVGDHNLPDLTKATNTPMPVPASEVRCPTSDVR